MNTEGEGSCLQGQERGLRGNQPCRHLSLGTPASRTVRKINFCCLNCPSKLIQLTTRRKSHQVEFYFSYLTEVRGSLLAECEGGYPGPPAAQGGDLYLSTPDLQFILAVLCFPHSLTCSLGSLRRWSLRLGCKWLIGMWF